MDFTADRQRPIFIESFALALNIERRLVAAAHALDKRDRKTVSAFEVGTPRYSNLSQLSTGRHSRSGRVWGRFARGASPWF